MMVTPSLPSLVTCYLKHRHYVMILTMGYIQMASGSSRLQQVLRHTPEPLYVTLGSSVAEGLRATSNKPDTVSLSSEHAIGQIPSHWLDSFMLRGKYPVRATEYVRLPPSLASKGTQHFLHYCISAPDRSSIFQFRPQI